MTAKIISYFGRFQFEHSECVNCYYGNVFLIYISGFLTSSYKGQLEDYWRVGWLCCLTPNFTREVGASVIIYPAVELFVTENSTNGNCTNDYCLPDEDYLNMMTEHIFPTGYKWILIIMHAVVFVVGLTGNFLVCLVVHRNPAMRTVTNYFIVNLAVADFLVILICLPPTLVWDTTETWFLGHVLCKLVLYLQTVSVAVSVLTLTFISLDRWYAICFPLKFKSTTSRAKTAILIIWIISLLYDIPELITLRTARRKKFHVETILFTQCIASWDDEAERHYTTSKIVFLYLLPLTITSAAYFQIVKVLWKSDNIPGHRYQRDVCFISGSSVDSRRYMAVSGRPTSGGTQAQIRSRRKAAKMLVCVVLMFALCYFPVHLLSILRYTVDIPQNDITGALAMLSHWLCYANSATNPLIYNFMSGKYRKEFRKTLTCCFVTKNDRICARNELACRDYRLTQITTARTETAHFGPSTTNFDMD